MPRIFHLCAITLALAALACAARESRPQVEVPPRMDLAEWTSIGIVTFDGEIDQKLAGQATRRFIEMIQAAQPGVRIVELGKASAVLEELGRDALDFKAARAMGDRYGISAVFTGLLEMEQARPRIKFGEVPASPARTGTRTIIGTIRKSWKSRIPRTVRPWGVSVSRLSP